MGKEPLALFKSFLALLLVFGTLLAAHWQYQRGIDRHHLNAKIEANISKGEVALWQALKRPEKYEWQPIFDSGEFEDSNILLRNHYFEGRYGFEVLTLFTPRDGQPYWVDRGWVEAGATAMDKPDIPPTPRGQVTIRGRFRLNSSLPQGTIFATGSSSNSPLIKELNAQKQITNQLFYVDLISGSTSELTPKVPAELPELSDGPHMAYAAQWLFFGGLIIYGRYLMRKNDLSNGKTKRA